MEWEAEGVVERQGPQGHVGWNEDGGGLHPAVATSVIGIDNWRVGTRVCPAAAELAANIEGFWRQMFPYELASADLDPRWKLLDSSAPNEPGLAWGCADPAPGQEGYPRLVIENRAYQTRAFRSMHLEIAVRQDGLQVVHCVMWPRRQYALPILAIDAVFNNGEMRFFIADASPVDSGSGGSLPPILRDAVMMLRAQFAGGLPPAGLPEWGAAIFSEHVVASRPALKVEADLCMMYAVALTRAYLLFAKRVAPLPEDAVDRLTAVDVGHRRCGPTFSRLGEGIVRVDHDHAADRMLFCGPTGWSLDGRDSFTGNAVACRTAGAWSRCEFFFCDVAEATQVL
jgi:phycocyanobilin:ferredoxin oxidoreductase